MTDPKPIRWFVLAACLCLTGGCGLFQGVPFISGGVKAAPGLEPMSYPSDAKIGAVLEIEVIRDGRAIVLDNRTVHEYSGVTLWLNQEYGARLTEVGIGRSGAVSLSGFVNRHGEVYPLGEFFHPDRDRALILAELEVGGELRKLSVRLVDGWRKP